MSKKRMLANAIAYGVSGVGCCLAASIMFHHADVFMKAFKEKGEN